MENSKKQVTVPNHIAALSNIILKNDGIRTATINGIKNWMKQKGIISSKKFYIQFTPTKFRIIADGLSREYYYTEEFFIKAFVASYSTFANSSQIILNHFVEKELDKSLNDIVNNNKKQKNTDANKAEEVSDSVSEEVVVDDANSDTGSKPIERNDQSVEVDSDNVSNDEVDNISNDETNVAESEIANN